MIVKEYVKPLKPMSFTKTIKEPHNEPDYVFKQWEENGVKKESHTLIIGNKKHVMSRGSFILFQQAFINQFKK